VFSTLLVLIQSTTDLDPKALTEGAPNQLWADGYTYVMNQLGAFIRTYSGLDLVLRITIILFPIVASFFLAVETRLKLGSKYLVLRGAAETVKRGIYSFRVLKGRIQDSPEVALPYNEQGLAGYLGRISKLLSDSDVNEAAFVPYGGPIPPNMFGAEEYDDGFSPLDPETYVQVRVGDQLKFYSLRTNQYEKRIRNLQYWMLILGGVGTFLAAVGAQYWLPLTGAIVSAATAYLEYQQLEQLLTKYNLTKSSLETVQADWQARSEKERQDPKIIQSLVRDVEAILESENQGWVQYIKQAQEPGEVGAKTAQG
jgi:SMODS and SLOG-associating 2TM effector domain 1